MKISSGLWKSAYGILAACALCLSGCGTDVLSDAFADLVGEGSGTPSMEAPAIGQYVPSMEEVAILNYDIPYQDPGVLVDLQGYSSGAEKIAYIKSKDELPATFALVNDETGEVVFEGTIQPDHSADGSSLLAGTADFSIVDTEGTYRILCPIVGSSYPFVIAPGRYRRLLLEEESAAIALCDDLVASPEQVLDLLQAYELCPEVFSDGDGDGTADVLTAAMQWIVGVDYDSISDEQATRYVAVLSKFSYLYQGKDVSLATECLQKASSMYSQAAGTMQQSSASFRALTELYRASGAAGYGEEIITVGSLLRGQSGFLDQEDYLFGTLTYMSTRQAVDRDLCSYLMTTLLERGEELGNRSRELMHPVLAKNDGPTELLPDAMQILCANRVLDGYEYNEMLENLLHYLRGRNLQSVSYDDGGSDAVHYLLLDAWMARLEANGTL
ncbi:MAG: hypothetical protein K5891_12455 [Lachnospiraceae bacterium]|nr:hypothetical protein [Lachnospiraceae bacterium]